MALKPNGAEITTITKQGRWTSLAFLTYIQNQISHLLASNYLMMSNPIPFFNILCVCICITYFTVCLDLTIRLVCARKTIASAHAPLGVHMHAHHDVITPAWCHAASGRFLSSAPESGTTLSKTPAFRPGDEQGLWVERKMLQFSNLAPITNIKFFVSDIPAY
jgi:hypothetical protein